MNTYIKHILFFLFLIFLFTLLILFNNENFIFLIKIFLFISFFYLFKITYLGEKIILFFNKSRLELFKVNWPSFKEVTKNVFIVCFLSLFMSSVIWFIDNIIKYLFFFINNLGL